MMNSKIGDAAFEALLYQAAADYYCLDLKKYPTRDKLEKMYVFSEQHNTKMSELFRIESRRERRKSALRISRRIAASFILAFTLLFGLLLLNPEVRAVVQNTIIEVYDKFISFRFNGVADGNNVEKEWEPSYLPNGFIEAKRERFGSLTMVSLECLTGETILLEYSYASNIQLSIDNEHTVYSDTTANDNIYYIFEAEKESEEHVIIWEMDGCSFTMRSEIELDDLLKIALSIASKK